VRERCSHRPGRGGERAGPSACRPVSAPAGRPQVRPASRREVLDPAEGADRGTEQRPHQNAHPQAAARVEDGGRLVAAQEGQPVDLVEQRDGGGDEQVVPQVDGHRAVVGQGDQAVEAAQPLRQPPPGRGAVQQDHHGAERPQGLGEGDVVEVPAAVPPVSGGPREAGRQAERRPGHRQVAGDEPQCSLPVGEAQDPAAAVHREVRHRVARLAGDGHQAGAEYRGQGERGEQGGPRGAAPGPQQQGEASTNHR
jgi:hypothetical protein